MANQGGSTSHAIREYRKGNWALSETMVLIEAKRMDDERRTKRSGENSEAITIRNKPTELRWKWVEDYCWRKGCSRSQNQCNDKWDNLMRDYKKVREYERRIAAEQQKGGDQGNREEVISYWKMEKNERKDKNLPSNMLPQIYQALVDVVENRKGSSAGQSMVMSTGVGSVSINPNIGYQHHHHRHVVISSSQGSAQPSILPPLIQHQISASAPIPPLLPLPPPPLPPQQAAAAFPPQSQPPPLPLPQPSQPFPTMCNSSDSDTSEYSDSPAKRRRRSSGGNGGEGTSTEAAGGSTSHEVGNAISNSASIIAEALQANEEREERRHRDLVSLHERRLKIEESKTEINRQGINGLVDAINKLANSILALASHNKNQSAPK